MANPRTVGMRHLVVTLSATVPAPISATQLFTTDFEVHAPAANVGASIYVGDSTVSSAWIPRSKSSTVNFVHGTGNFLGVDPAVSFDLNKIYLLGSNNGDTAIVQYYAGDRH